jgi:hypothetical protein
MPMKATAIAMLFIAVFWTAILAVAAPRLLDLWRLSRSGVKTEGVVASVDRLDHNRATYSYEVEGNRYSSSEIASHRRAGERVAVYYWPHDPSVSSLVAPNPVLREGLFGTAILCALVAAASIGAGLRAR